MKRRHISKDYTHCANDEDPISRTMIGSTLNNIMRCVRGNMATQAEADNHHNVNYMFMSFTSHFR